MGEIKMDVQRMVKRRKDSGFTLIELMIVIAVIGILAVVLVPKVGAVKTQAKSAGIDTNMRSVQGYVQSRINSWANANGGAGTTNANIAADIVSALSGGTDLMGNPFTGSKIVTNVIQTGTWGNQDAVDIYSSAPATQAQLAGTIVVVPDPLVNSSATGLYIYAYDNAGRQMVDKTIRITP